MLRNVANIEVQCCSYIAGFLNVRYKTRRVMEVGLVRTNILIYA